MSAKTLDEFKEVYTCHFCNLADYGITKQSTSVTMEDKVTIVQSITLHHVLLKSKAEVDQFAEGLSCLGTKSFITKYPNLFRTFVGCWCLLLVRHDTLIYCLIHAWCNAEVIRTLFKSIRYSQTGSNEKEKEEQLEESEESKLLF